jgi:hypothetical protein
MRTLFASKLSADRRARSIKSAVRWLVVFALCVSAGACAASAGTPAPSAPTRVETTDGPFHLSFEMSKTTWRTTEAIDGTATLSLAGDSSVTISGSSFLIGFEFASADGTRHVVPIRPADCGTRAFEPSQPLTAPLGRRAGDGWTTTEQADPLLHLTPGDWTITAVAQFADGSGCTAVPHNLTASISIHVSA